MLIVAVTFLPFFMIGFTYFISGLRSVCENNETWLYYIFLYAVNKEFLPLRLSTLSKTWTHLKSTLMDIYINYLSSERKSKEYDSQLAVSVRSEDYPDQKFEESKVQKAELSIAITNASCDISPDVLGNETLERVSQESFSKKQLQKTSNINEKMLTIQLLKNHISKLKKEFTIVSEWVRFLRNDNNTLKVKVINIEKTKKTFDASIKEKVEKLEGMLEDKSNQVKNLWGAIQILDDENIKLKRKRNAWKSSEKKLKNEIKALKMNISNKGQKTNFYVSLDTVDWKKKVDHESAARRTQIQKSVRKKNSSSRSKLRRWTKRRMKKSLKSLYENSE